jgi:hypothetical protein
MAVTSSAAGLAARFSGSLARRRWIRRPARPVRYGIVVRLADTYAGYRDGSRGVPALPAGEATVPPRRVGTPRLEAIRHRAREQTEQERIALERERAGWTEQLLEVRARLDALAADEQECRHRLDAARTPATPEDLGQRRFAEADRPVSLIHARRRAERDRLRDALAAEHARAVDQLAAAQRSAAVVEELTTRRAAVARARGRRLYEHACRRGATYWQQLLRSHPDGPALNGHIEPVGPDLPEWVIDPAPPDDAQGAPA